MTGKKKKANVPIFRKTKKKDLRNISLSSASRKNMEQILLEAVSRHMKGRKGCLTAQIYQKHITHDQPDTFPC